jgi:hypothetical protein
MDLRDILYRRFSNQVNCRFVLSTSHSIRCNKIIWLTPWDWYCHLPKYNDTIQRLPQMTFCRQDGNTNNVLPALWYFIQLFLWINAQRIHPKPYSKLTKCPPFVGKLLLHIFFYIFRSSFFCKRIIHMPPVTCCNWKRLPLHSIYPLIIFYQCFQN